MPRNRVQVPAVGMIVVAGLDAAFALLMLFLSLLGMSWLRMSETMTGAWGNDVAESIMKGGFGVMLCVIGILIDAVIILGANKMRNLNSYGFAVAAAILSIIPCLSSPCFVLGMPFGIWALVVLMNEEVRNAFLGSGKRPQPSMEPQAKEKQRKGREGAEPRREKRG